RSEISTFNRVHSSEEKGKGTTRSTKGTRKVISCAFCASCSSFPLFRVLESPRDDSISVSCRPYSPGLGITGESPPGTVVRTGSAWVTSVAEKRGRRTGRRHLCQTPRQSLGIPPACNDPRR